MPSWRDKLADATEKVGEKVAETAQDVKDKVSGEPTGEFEVYQDANGEFRWRLQDTNNRIIADSGEGYSAKSGCLAGIEDVKAAVGNATINDMTA